MVDETLVMYSSSMPNMAAMVRILPEIKAAND
jgi:hypothetical protein